MILADTSVWAEHLRKRNEVMLRLLELDAIILHPLVIGEIAMGSLRDREQFLEWLSSLRRATIAGNDEVMALIEGERLYSSGMGFIDAHLLASTLITPDARLWTRDRRLREAAERMDVAVRPWGRD